MKINYYCSSPVYQANSEEFWHRAGILGRKSIALLLSTVLATQPLLVHASELLADPNAQVGQLPVITSGNNSVPVVDIAKPNDVGLSHNKYDTFNVGTQGVILNNSVEGFSQSQLGGLLSSNPHLQGSSPASVILNEVTGATRSLLQGMLEVHGTPANVIIANPHGLTCNGCGFLNTPRVTLSTGTPEFGDDLSLKGLTVKGGDVTIGEKGANLSSVSIFDVVSRKISVQGPVSGKDQINLVAGGNRYDYASGNAEALSGDGQEPEIAIDSSALGGMYAGRIRIVSNDKGSGVNMQGQMASNAGELSISADGKLTLRSAKAAKEISARSRSASVRVEHTIFSEEAVVLEGHASVEVADNAILYAGGDAALSGKSVSIGNGAMVAAGANREGFLSHTGTLAIKSDVLTAGGASLAAGMLLSIAANEVHIANTAPEDKLVLRSRGDVKVQANTINAANSVTAADGNTSISSEQGLILNHGYYQAKGKLSIEAAATTTSASLYGREGVSVQTKVLGLLNLGEISASSDVLLTSAIEITNSGKILSSTRVGLSAATHIANNQGAVVSGSQSVDATAGTIVNHGKIGSSLGHIVLKSRGEVKNIGDLQAKSNVSVEAASGVINEDRLLAGGVAKIVTPAGPLQNRGTITAQNAEFDAKSFDNSGTITVSNVHTANIAGTATNHGTITATDLLFHLVGDLSNHGRIFGANKVVINGKDAGFAGKVANTSNAVMNGMNTLYMAAREVWNAGSIGSANGSVDVKASGSLSNQKGLFYSRLGASYQVDGAIANVGGDIISDAALSIKGLKGPLAASLWNESGNIQAVSGDLYIGAREITNRRTSLPTITESKSSSTEKKEPPQPEKRQQHPGRMGEDYRPPNRSAPKQEPARTITTVTTRESGSVSGTPGKILAGGNLSIDANKVVNSYSQIAARSGISIQGGTVTNEGRDLLETIDVTTVIHHEERHCRIRVGWCWKKHWYYWDETLHDKQVNVIGSLYGTIEAGSWLYLSAKGYVHNNAVRGDLGGLSVGGHAKSLTATSAPGPVVLPQLAEVNAMNVSVEGVLGRQAIFQPTASPEAPFVIETRSEFIDPKSFLESVYFLDRIPPTRSQR